MKSIQKMYTLVGIVSLLYGGIILSQPFSSFSFKNIILKFFFNQKKKTLSIKKNKRTSCKSANSNFLAEAIKNEEFEDSMELTDSALKLVCSFKNLSYSYVNDKEQIKKERDFLANQYVELVNQKFVGTIEEIRVKDEIREGLIHSTLKLRKNLTDVQKLGASRESDTIGEVDF